MAMLGQWGTDLIFQVDSNTQLPFTDMKRKVKARWATHNILQAKPRAEYQGLEQIENSMRITFSAYRGQSPRYYIERLEESCRNGDIYYLYIGGKRVGTSKCYLESIDSEWEEIWNKGELVRASVDVTFKEYT